MSGLPLPTATRPCSSKTVPQSEVMPPCSESMRPLLPYHWTLSPAPAAVALKTMAMEKAVAPPKGVLLEVSQWRLKRTTEPPIGVAFFLNAGCSPGEPATVRLLALVHDPTKSPSLRKSRSEASQRSMRAAGVERVDSNRETMKTKRSDIRDLDSPAC